MVKKKKKKIRKIPGRKRRIRNNNIPIFAEEEYSSDETEVIEKFITDSYGSIEAVVHDLDYNRLHIDINIVAPTFEKPYWKLITSGMGAHEMEVPEKLKDVVPKRCELMLAVEPFWIYQEGPVSNYVNEDLEISNGLTYKSVWPIGALRALAFLPIMESRLMRELLTIDLSDLKYDLKTELKEVLILRPQDIEEDKNTAYLPNGEPVAFYQVVPITSKEREAIHEASNPPDVIRHLPYIWSPDRKSTV